MFHRYSSIRIILGKLAPNTPTDVLGHTESNPEFPASHLTLNEVLLECQGYLRVDLYLFQGIWGIRAIWGNWAPVP